MAFTQENVFKRGGKYFSQNPNSKNIRPLNKEEIHTYLLNKENLTPKYPPGYIQNQVSEDPNQLYPGEYPETLATPEDLGKTIPSGDGIYRWGTGALPQMLQQRHLGNLSQMYGQFAADIENRAAPTIQKGADALGVFNEAITPNIGLNERIEKYKRYGENLGFSSEPTTGFEKTLEGFMEKLGNLQMTMFNNIKDFSMSDKNPLSGVGEGIASTLARQNPVTNEIPGIFGEQGQTIMDTPIQGEPGFDESMFKGIMDNEDLLRYMQPGPKVPK